MSNIANVVDMNARKTIKEQALDWLIRIDGEEKLSSKEKKEFSDWLALSEAHQKEFRQLSNMWQSKSLVLLLSEFEARQAEELSLTRWRAGFKMKTAMTAMVMLIIGVLFFLQQSVTPEVAFSTNGVYATAIGEQSLYELSDGSYIQLNTNSRIRVEYTEEYRNIQLLSGEVHFDVAKSREHPFRVYAGGSRVQAVGTAFNVHLGDGAVSVLVTEGRVAFSSTKDDSGSGHSSQVEPGKFNFEKQDNLLEVKGYLDAGQRISTEANSQAPMNFKRLAITVDGSELERLQAWRSGMLVYNGQPLSELLHEVTRFTNVSFDVIDEEVNNIEVGGRFRVEELDNIVMILEDQFELSVTRVGYNLYQISSSK